MSGLYGTFALPCICTPIVTYVFIAKTAIGWRGAYWLMTAWHGFGIICMYLFYHPPKFSTKHSEDEVSKWTLLKELDYVGLLLFTAGTTLFLVGLNFGGRSHPWASAATIAPIVIGFLCLVALFVWVFNVPMKYPLLPPKLFRQWRGYVSLMCTFWFAVLTFAQQIQRLGYRQLLPWHAILQHAGSLAATVVTLVRVRRSTYHAWRVRQSNSLGYLV
jgi:MFS family permease